MIILTFSTFNGIRWNTVWISFGIKTITIEHLNKDMKMH
jgi:hypothetical protein